MVAVPGWVITRRRCNFHVVVATESVATRISARSGERTDDTGARTNANTSQGGDDYACDASANTTCASALKAHEQAGRDQRETICFP